MTKRDSAIAIGLAVAVFGTAVPASAQLSQQQQQQQQRPYRGLFGGGVGDTSQQLTLGASLGGGYYSRTARTVTPPPATTAPRSGQYGVASANLSYSLNLSRVTAGLSARAGGRYYPQFSDPFVPNYSFGGHLTWAAGSRTSLSTSHHAALRPHTVGFFSGDPFGGEAALDAPLDPNASSATSTYQSWGSSVSLSHSLTQRLALNAGYNYYSNNVWSGSGGGAYGAHSGRAGLRFSLAKGLGLRAGYAATGAPARTPGQSPYRGRTIDAGIDFNRALSLTRTTTLSFGTGLAGVSGQNSSRIRYHFVGHVNLGHQMGRSWTVFAGYNRSANFFQTLGQPVLRDMVNAGVGGLIGRRLQVNGGVAVIKGTVGLGTGAPDYTAGHANLDLQIGLTRLLALGVNYGLYHYEFDDAVLLPAGLSSKMDRQSVRVSLNVWVPLIIRVRRD